METDVSNKVELVPDAHLLLSSLRSVGYKEEMAIADIIDNCIAAHASEIHVDFIWNAENSLIAIYDNGNGMDRSSLITSMKIGSADPLDKRLTDDLGRFGMGMKTASFSMGKQLRVFTKNETQMSTACWDLDYIEGQHDGKWSLLVDDIDPTTIYADYPAFSTFQTGTLILIGSLDRMIDPSELAKSKKSFYRTTERVRNHVGMIFHRFIEEDDLKIYFKEDRVPAWDPFILSNNATQELGEEEYFDGDKYVLVTELIPQLLELVDLGKMGMRPAVELSYLDKDDQALVYELMLDCVCTPSHAQAIRIRRLAEKEILCEDLVEEIMREEKGNQKEKIHIRYDQIRDYIPRNISYEETTEYIKAALKYYQEAHAKK